MTLKDWVDDSRRRFRDESVGDAVKGSARELGIGISLRLLSRLTFGTPIWQREGWDICVVLDSCRVDLMREVAGGYDWLPEIDSMWSVGSASPEWLDSTFHPRHSDEMAKTAYITGNPFSAKPSERIPSAHSDVLPLGADDFALFDEAWRHRWTEDPVSTVPPRPLTDRAIDVWRRRRELGVEKIVVHYMQPHIPFRSRPEWFGQRENLDHFGEPGKEEVEDAWFAVRDGEIPKDTFWEAYADNLAWVLDDVELLRRNADARIALTSDHGNGFGEFDIWSHPPGCPHPAVRKVPWAIVSGTDSGEYTPTIEDVEPEGSDDVVDRLDALGYR